MDSYLYYNTRTGTVDEVGANNGLTISGGGASGLDPSRISLTPQRDISGGPAASTVSGPAITAVQGAGTGMVNSGPTAEQIAQARKVEQANRLRGEVTNVTNTIRDLYNSRFGLVDTVAADALGKLGERYATEAADVTSQAADENAAVGAAYSAGGTYDSSYRGNTQDLVTKGAERQIRDLGTELEGNKAKVGAQVAGQKGSFNAAKAGIDAIAARLAEVTDPAELESIKQSLEGRIRDLQAGGSEFNTMQQNMSAIASLAPAGARGQQLQTTLSKIVGSSSLSPEMKIAMGTRVIQGSGAPQDEQDKLLQAFTSDIGTNRTTV